MQTSLQLSIIIVNWNTRDFLKRCLQSIKKTCSGFRYEVIVVDNASSDGSVSMVEKHFPWVKLIANKENKGFAKGANQGYENSSGKNILILNSDIEAHAKAFKTMIEYIEKNPKVGAASCKFLNPDGTLQRLYRRFPTIPIIFFNWTLIGKFIDRRLGKHFSRLYYVLDVDFSKVTPIDQPGATCILIRRELIEKIGLFDERFPLFFNDVDLCKRIWESGYRIHVLPNALITHYGGASTKLMPTYSLALESLSGLYQYFKKHHGRMKALVVRCMITLDMIINVLILQVLSFGRVPKIQSLYLLNAEEKEREIDLRVRLLKSLLLDERFR